MVACSPLHWIATLGHDHYHVAPAHPFGSVAFGFVLLLVAEGAAAESAHLARLAQCVRTAERLVREIDEGDGAVSFLVSLCRRLDFGLLGNRDGRLLPRGRSGCLQLTCWLGDSCCRFLLRGFLAREGVEGERLETEGRK